MSSLIHNHFEGSFHCVECGGQCRLVGIPFELSEFVRNVCEFFACRGDQWLPPQMEIRLKAILGDEFYPFWDHCKKSMLPIAEKS